jgi:hypothetical protein
VTIDVCFLGGFGRSGSTLLERVVAELPGVCSLGEVRHLWYRGVADNELCACGAHFHDCEFWTPVGELAFGGWDNVEVGGVRRLARQVDRMRYVPTGLMAGELSAYHAVAREYADYFARVYRAAAVVSGASMVLDSSKNASTACALRTHEQIQLRVLHVIRDSRGVAHSWAKQVRRPEADSASSRPLMDSYPPWTSALLWDAHNIAFTVLGSRGTPVHRVFYEQFLADPLGATEAIAKFLGIDGSSVPEFLDGHRVRLGATHQAAGNPMRFAKGELAFRADDAWRTKMPTGARRTVTGLTWPLMRRYGYHGVSGVGR